MKLPVSVCKLQENAILPTYGSPLAAGADLYALPGKEITVSPGETVFFSTGIAVAIPEGYVGLIYARSGLSCKSDLAPANKVGVIDADYRGEIRVALHNHGTSVRTVAGGDRIAQLVVAPVAQADFRLCDTLDDTARGKGGFGSTGK